MAFTSTQLATELSSDPKLLGYSALGVGGNDQAVTDKIDQIGASGETVSVGVISSYLIINATDPAEWAALTAQEKQRYQTLIGAGQLDTSNPNIRSAFQAMFAAGTTTRANLTALLTRQASRAEALWGAGTVVTNTDVAKALRG